MIIIVLASNLMGRSENRKHGFFSPNLQYDLFMPMSSPINAIEDFSVALGQFVKLKMASKIMADSKFIMDMPYIVPDLNYLLLF